MNTKGFTLLELSIVLVIIGLIVSGVFTGRELIQQAGIRKQLGQIEGYNAAVLAFQNKYSCLPGDCANASTNNLGKVDITGSTNGNGDGIIGDPLSLAGDEALNMFKHLADARMITPKSGYDATNATTPPIVGIHTPPLELDSNNTNESTLPGTNTRGGISISPPNRLSFLNWPAAFDAPSEKHAWILTTSIADNMYGGTYLPAVANQMDQKIDDGFPTSGNMRSPNFIANGSGNWFDYVFTTDPLGAGSCILAATATAAASYNVSITEETKTISSYCLPLIYTDF